MHVTKCCKTDNKTSMIKCETFFLPHIVNHVNIFFFFYKTIWPVLQNVWQLMQLIYPEAVWLSSLPFSEPGHGVCWEYLRGFPSAISIAVIPKDHRSLWNCQNRTFFNNIVGKITNIFQLPARLMGNPKHLHVFTFLILLILSISSLNF